MPPRSETIAEPQVPTRLLLTREGERELRAKLEALQEEIRVELPRRMRSAREFGEASDNGDCLQLHEEEAVARAQVRALGEVLTAAKIVDAGDAVTGVVAIGATVTIRTGNRTIERRLVGAYEVDEGCVSASSPIGRAILGRSVGDEVLAELPSGAELELEIVAVETPEAEPAAA